MRMATSMNGQTLATSKTVPPPQDFDQAIQTFKKVADEISGGEKIAAIAGGLAGPLDKEKTMLITSPHLGSWVHKPFRRELEKIFGVTVYLENDADLATLGEASFGAGVNQKIVAYLTISTGVGGGRVVDKKIDSNSLGFEPGHQIIVPDGHPCNCGGKGHLESYVSGSALERIYGQKGETITDTKIWDQVARYLAIGLNNTIVHWSPDIVILGGSVTKSVPLDQVRSYLKEVLTIFPNPPEIVPAKLGDVAGLFGALYLLTLF